VVSTFGVQVYIIDLIETPDLGRNAIEVLQWIEFALVLNMVGKSNPDKFHYRFFRRHRSRLGVTGTTLEREADIRVFQYGGEDMPEKEVIVSGPVKQYFTHSCLSGE
jgi:hypothetical protein